MLYKTKYVTCKNELGWNGGGGTVRGNHKKWLVFDSKCFHMDWRHLLSIVNCMKCVVFILDGQSEYIIQALRASTTHWILNSYIGKKHNLMRKLFPNLRFCIIVHYDEWFFEQILRINPQWGVSRSYKFLWDCVLQYSIRSKLLVCVLKISHGLFLYTCRKLRQNLHCIVTADSG